MGTRQERLYIVGDVEAAVTSARAATEADPRNAVAHLALGRALAPGRVVRPPSRIADPGRLTVWAVPVLRLLADSCTTREIAGELCYSERTIRSAIQAMTTRLRLRNRSHALAYALRQGLI